MADNVCVCGRSYTHCKRCGARSVYVKKLRSMELRQVVIGCRTCSFESKETEPCQAPSREFNASFIKKTEANEVAYTPGSDEHARLLTDWVVEMQRKKSWTSVQVYIEAQKAGWHLEAFGDKLDEDIKQALIERGLWPLPESGVSSTTVAPEVQVQVLPSGPVQEPIGLDEIIKGMQEEQK